MSTLVQAWGGPRDGELFLVTGSRPWDAFPGGSYSLDTVERRDHKLVILRRVFKWHQQSVHT